MGLKQYYYTSCDIGLSGNRGFQVNAMTSGISSEVLAVLDTIADYTSPDNAPRQPTEEEIHSSYPVTLLYLPLKSGDYLLANIQYVGKEFVSGDRVRGGNHFCHALIGSFAQLESNKLLPINTWRSRFWVNRPSPDTEIPELPHLEAGTLTESAILNQILLIPDGIRFLGDMLTFIIDSIDVRPPRKIVLLTTDDEQAVSWIAAATSLLPRRLSLKVSFSSYEYDPQRNSALLIATRVNTVFRYSDPDINPSLKIFDFISERFARPLKSHPLAEVMVGVLEENGWSGVNGFLELEKGVHDVVPHHTIEPTDLILMNSLLSGEYGRGYFYRVASFLIDYPEILHRYPSLFKHALNSFAEYKEYLIKEAIEKIVQFIKIALSVSSLYSEAHKVLLNDLLLAWIPLSRQVDVDKLKSRLGEEVRCEKPAEKEIALLGFDRFKAIIDPCQKVKYALFLLELDAIDLESECGVDLLQSVIFPDIQQTNNSDRAILFMGSNKKYTWNALRDFLTTLEQSELEEMSERLITVPEFVSIVHDWITVSATPQQIQKFLKFPEDISPKDVIEIVSGIDKKDVTGFNNIWSALWIKKELSFEDAEYLFRAELPVADWKGIWLAKIVDRLLENENLSDSQISNILVRQSEFGDSIIAFHLQEFRNNIEKIEKNKIGAIEIQNIIKNSKAALRGRLIEAAFIWWLNVKQSEDLLPPIPVYLQQANINKIESILHSTTKRLVSNSDSFDQQLFMLVEFTFRYEEMKGIFSLREQIKKYLKQFPPQKLSDIRIDLALRYAHHDRLDRIQLVYSLIQSKNKIQSFKQFTEKVLPNLKTSKTEQNILDRTLTLFGENFPSNPEEFLEVLRCVELKHLTDSGFLSRMIQGIVGKREYSHYVYAFSEILLKVPLQEENHGNNKAAKYVFLLATNISKLSVVSDPEEFSAIAENLSVCQKKFSKLVVIEKLTTDFWDKVISAKNQREVIRKLPPSFFQFSAATEGLISATQSEIAKVDSNDRNLMNVYVELVQYLLGSKKIIKPFIAKVLIGLEERDKLLSRQLFKRLQNHKAFQNNWEDIQDELELPKSSILSKFSDIRNHITNLFQRDEED
ncbi:hypothetical protein K8I28_00675 [bacterium]|nr:hypothetical protein [bacterium]